MKKLFTSNYYLCKNSTDTLILYVCWEEYIQNKKKLKITLFFIIHIYQLFISYLSQFFSLQFKFLVLKCEFLIRSLQSSFFRGNNFNNLVIDNHSSDPSTKPFTGSWSVAYIFRVKIRMRVISTLKQNMISFILNIF